LLKYLEKRELTIFGDTIWRWRSKIFFEANYADLELRLSELGSTPRHLFNF